MGQQNRVRGWVFGKVEPDKLRDRYNEKKIKELGGDKFVVVRIDTVKHNDYNVIIPVDAEDDAGLRVAESVIEEQLGVDIVSTARVVEKGHFPDPPHNANGYITPQEHEHGDPDAPIGPVNKSPGWNAWG